MKLLPSRLGCDTKAATRQCWLLVKLTRHLSHCQSIQTLFTDCPQRYHIQSLWHVVVSPPVPLPLWRNHWWLSHITLGGDVREITHILRRLLRHLKWVRVDTRSGVIGVPTLKEMHAYGGLVEGRILSSFAASLLYTTVSFQGSCLSSGTVFIKRLGVRMLI